MAGIGNSNFYVDLDVITTLRDSFDKEIEKLTELFFQVDKEIKSLGTNNAWTGSSYDAFKREYKKWNLEYLQRLTQLLQLKQYLEEVRAITEELIKQRNALPSYLGV